MGYGTMTMPDGTQLRCYNDMLLHGSPAPRKVGDLVHWSSDGQVASGEIVAVFPLADIPFTRCDTCEVAYFTAWGYTLSHEVAA